MSDTHSWEFVSEESSRSIANERMQWIREYALNRIDVLDSDTWGRLSPGLILDFASQGLFAPHLPREIGGLGLTLSDTLRLIEQVAAIDPTLAAFLVGHYTSTLPIFSFGSARIRETWLPSLAQGRQIGAFALTEPSAGSNPRAMETIAKVSGAERWRIHGRKSYVGNAAWAGILTVFAKHEHGEHRGISAFAIPRSTRGLHVGPEARTMGVRAMIQSAVVLDDVEVTAEHLLGKPGQGLHVADTGLRLGRLAIGAICLGTMKRSAQLAYRYASKRQIGTGLLLANPVTRQRLTHFDAAIAAIEAMVKLLSSLVDKGEHPPDEAFLACKVASSELAFQVADETMQMLGARGYDEANLVAKMVRDIRFLRIGEGPTEALLMQLGASIDARDPALRDFFAKCLGASVIYDRLLTADASLRERRSVDIDSGVALQWRYYQIGQLAMWSLLEAAVGWCENRASQSPQSTKAIDWVRSEYERANFESRAVPSWLSPDQVEQRLSHYAVAVGGLDETLGIAAQNIDPLLRADPITDPSIEASTPIAEPELEIPAPFIHSLAVEFPVDRIFRDGGALITTTATELSVEQTRDLSRLAHNEKVRIEDIFAAAFVVLLARCSNQLEFAMLRHESERLTRAIPIELSDPFSFRELISHVNAPAPRRSKTWMTPRDAVREILAQRENADHTVVARLVSGGIRVAFTEGLTPVNDLRGIDLTLAVQRQGERFSLMFHHDALLFEPETLLRRMENLKVLLEAVAMQPNAHIGALPLLPRNEFDQVVHGWNGPTTDDSYWKRCAHEVIEAQVDKTPHAIAVQTPYEKLTYAELDRRANRLAACLRARGIGKGAVVGVATGRTSALIVATLGALKIGAAFLPLNLNHPADRLRWMIDEANVSVLVVEPGTAALMPTMKPAMICIDGDVGDLSIHSDKRLASEIDFEAPAYIIFTSGSTGRPKGTVVPHGSLVNEFFYRRDAFGLDETDRALQTAAPGFDIAVWEFLGPLSYGGRIVLSGGQSFLWDAGEVIRLINQYEISTIQIVPSQLTVLLGQVKGDDIKTIRLVVCGGESLPKSLAARFFETAARGLHNFYGPTEATIEATVWRCDPDDRSPTAPIGFATTNRRVYVLDERLQPVPIGVSGELYIGGVGLAIGYLNQPELTAQRFLEDPFIPGGRMYRTGDRVYYRSDGALQFLGRMDRQLKVRGVRIEPGEIEAMLSTHEDIDQVVVGVQEAAAGDKRLVAYVTTHLGQQPTVSSLRDFARMKLPREMVPSAFVVVEAFARTGTGKVDMKVLPRVDWRTLESNRDPGPAAPKTTLEESITLVWREVLGREIHDVDADFFELGGHSLLATQVLSRLRERLGTEIGLRDFFAAPTVRALAELIEREPGSAIANANVSSSLMRLSREKPQSLHPSQERLWYMQKLAPHSGAYNVADAAKLVGKLSIEFIQAALTEVGKRHEALRTRFVTHDGIPAQQVVSEAAVDLQIVTVSPANLDSALEAEARRPFDLETENPFRVVLFRLAENEHVLLWVFHHIAADGWSAGGIFVRELSQFYTAFVQGQPLPGGAPTFQLIDYADWLAKRLTPERIDRHLGYWRQTLHGASTQLGLPTDRPRPAKTSFEGARVFFDVPASAVRSLRDLAKREGVTLFAALLSGFQVLLSVYSGQDDFLVGAAIAGRYHAAIESVMGNFANTVALRADLTRDPSLRDLIRRAHETVLGAVEHGEMPFEQLVSALNPERSLGENPLFQAALTLYNGALSGLSLSGLQAETVRFDPGVAKFDLTVSLLEERDKLGGYVEFSTALFDRATIARMIAHYLSILQQMGERPDHKVSEVDFLTDNERRLLLSEWNGQTRTPDVTPACIHELFEAQVARKPDHCAVRHGKTVLSYSELNTRANQLAHHLRQLGVGPETLVGLCLERTPVLIVGILGILKAGAAYVPVDPAYPKDRLAYTLSDAAITLVVTEAATKDVLPNDPNLRCILLDTDSAAIAAQPQDNPLHLTTPQNLAYVIYTSGSTGQPKGVAVEHRGVSILVNSSNELFSDEDVAGSLAAASVCFDMSVWEFVVSLCRGGTMILVENILSLLDLPQDAGITFVTAVPSAIAELLRNGAIPASVRTMLLGGEFVSSPLVQQLYDLGTIKRIFDGYGPTETTIFSTWARRTRNGPATIGRPVPGTEVYVLDRAGRLAPLGVPGELHIGGMGIARGYLHRPELTTARFIRHPFRRDPRARLYKTGDLVRFLPDGNLDYVGRIDNQIKIRGYRIELGEIETSLLLHPGVREAFVLARDHEGDKMLVAYIVATHETDPSTLRSFLETRLPKYMIPSAFLMLDTLPLLPNGKVDKHRLRALDLPTTTNVSAPRDSIELALLRTWEDLLKRPVPSVECSFFDAGGHSLLAIQLITRIEREFGVKLPLSALYEDATIAGLAARLRKGGSAEKRGLLVRLKKGSMTPPLFLVHPVSGLSICYHEMAQAMDRTVYGIQAPTLINGDAAPTNLDTMARSYIDVVRKTQTEGPYLLGGWSLGGVIAFEMARQLEALGEVVAGVVMVDSLVPTVQLRALDGATVLVLFLREISERFQTESHLGLEALRKLSANERMNAVLEEAKRLGGLAEGTDPDLLQRMVDFCAASTACYQAYSPQPIQSPLVVFRAEDQRHYEGQLVDPRQGLPLDLGWGVFASRVILFHAPGEHMSLLFGSRAAALGARINTCLQDLLG